MSKEKRLGLFLGIVTGFILSWAGAPVIDIPAIFTSEAFAPAETTYFFDHRFVYLVPTIDTVMEVVNTSGTVVDSFAGTIPNQDSIPFGTLGRLLDGPTNQGLFITHNWTLPQVDVLDSLEVDSVYTSWSLVEIPAYLILIEGFPLDTPGPPQQPPGNITPDPVTNLVLTADTSITSIVANWTESVDSYQVISGFNSGPGADINDSTDAPPQAHTVTVDSLYFMCVRAFAGDSISDSRCSTIQYTGPGPPPSGNDPVFTEDFESFTTATWQAMDAAQDPYNLTNGQDQFIETSGSAEGDNHLRLFRAAKSSPGAGCNNNSVGFEITSNAAPGVDFGTLMAQATEFWMEFYIKYDASPSSAPWGTNPDPDWDCSSAPDHKLLRLYVDAGGSFNYWAMKDGHFTADLWSVGVPRKDDGSGQTENDAGPGRFWWDNTWHLIRIHGKRSSSRGVLDAEAHFTIDSAGVRIILNKAGRGPAGDRFDPHDELDIWWVNWLAAEWGLNRNHWTNHDAQYRMDLLRIWTNTGNGGPGWTGVTLEDAP